MRNLFQNITLPGNYWQSATHSPTQSLGDWAWPETNLQHTGLTRAGSGIESHQLYGWVFNIRQHTIFFTLSLYLFNSTLTMRVQQLWKKSGRHHCFQSHEDGRMWKLMNEYFGWLAQLVWLTGHWQLTSKVVSDPTWHRCAKTVAKYFLLFPHNF